MEKTTPEAIRSYLKRPYARTVIPESNGTYRGEIVEFPGCIAHGNTASEALTSLEEIAESWLESALARGQKIPDPIEAAEFSGRLVLRLPKSLHKKAAHLAERDGVSLNQFIVASVAEQTGERSRPALMVTMNAFAAVGPTDLPFSLPTAGGETPTGEFQSLVGTVQIGRQLASRPRHA